jgi:hypothetical protein
MMPAGPGNSSSGRTYCCPTPAANRSADNRAGHSASPGLCKRVSQRRCRRKTKQEQ